MTISGASDVNVAAELAMLRGEMATGFERINGQLNMIAQAQTVTAKDVSELETRVTALEERRWPIGVIAAVSGVVSAVVAAGAFLVGQ
uniref:Holin n=1 Tax=Streptomyces phage Geonosis TaxID=3158856 RepID=A0AAU7GY26_9CAUD